MQIKVRTLYEKITQYIPDAKIKMIGNVNLDIVIEGIRIFSMQEKAPQPQFLYVCVPENCKHLPESYKETLFLCITHSAQKQVIDCGLPMIVLETEFEVSQVLNALMELLIVLKNMDITIRAGMLEEYGLQEMLLMGESLFSNIYMIIDSGFKLKGYSRGRETKDEMYQNTIQTGALDTFYIKQLIINDVFDDFQKNGEILLPEHNCLSEVPVFIKQIIDKNMLLGYGLLICTNTPPMQEMLNFFSEFCSGFRKYLLADNSTQHMLLEHKQELLFTGIIQRIFPNEDEIKSLAENLGIEMDENYYLIRIEYQKWKNIPRTYILMQLGRIGDEQLLFFYQQGIQILIKEQAFASFIEKNISKIYQASNKLHGICGISDVFASLNHLDVGYLQAKKAIEHGVKLNTVKKKLYYQYSNEVFYYHKYIMIDMIHCYYKNYNILPPCLPELKELLKLDLEKNTNNVQILFTYMQCGYSINSTAKALYMHRNSLVYRLELIDKIIQKDYKNDNDFRKELALTYHVLDYETAYLKEEVKQEV